MTILVCTATDFMECGVLHIRSTYLPNKYETSADTLAEATLKEKNPNLKPDKL